MEERMYYHPEILQKKMFIHTTIWCEINENCIAFKHIKGKLNWKLNLFVKQSWNFLWYVTINFVISKMIKTVITMMCSWMRLLVDFDDIQSEMMKFSRCVVTDDIFLIRTSFKKWKIFPNHSISVIYVG